MSELNWEADHDCVDRIEPAVNVSERANGRALDILLLHYTGMEDGASALRWLCCEESKVSCHYLIFENGETVQMVPEAQRAHHAGVGSWEGETDTNSRSIGIEIVNGGHPAGLPDFPRAQMERVAELSRAIIARHAIAPHHVLGHSDTAPGRKIDPGEKFDWPWLASEGVGLWVKPVEIVPGPFLQQGDSGAPVEALQAMLELYGYGLPQHGTFDDATRIVVEAFQRHFRPAQVDGVADRSTVDTLRDLLRARDAVSTNVTVT